MPGGNRCPSPPCLERSFGWHRRARQQALVQLVPRHLQLRGRLTTSFLTLAERLAAVESSLATIVQHRWYVQDGSKVNEAVEQEECSAVAVREIMNEAVKQKECLLEADREVMNEAMSRKNACVRLTVRS